MSYKLEKLNAFYREAEQCDSSLFAEMRTNIQLKNGNHYNDKAKGILDEFRSKGVITRDQKIRLTKNHIHRITNIYENYILDGNPDVSAVPFNDDELQDFKAAEQANAVFSWVKKTNVYKHKRRQFVADFVVIGECVAKVRFDYNKGEAVAIDGETGTEIKNGEIVIDKILPFELKRDPMARTWEESRWIIHDHLIERFELKKLVAQIAPELIDKINFDELGKDSIRIFDTNTSEYTESANKTYLREFYQKPCEEYPRGWYAMFTKEFPIVQMPLPGGLWPWIVGGFDNLTTSPRAASIIRTLRPYQVEINRSSSKMAEHQITLGDDKVLIQSGTKMGNGGKFDGVRVYTISGKDPTILPGRNGAQYLDYQLAQVKEMYEAANLAHIMTDKEPKGDAFLMLYTAMNDRKKFVKYVEAYQQFEIELFDLVYKFCKQYLNENHIIKAAGRSEGINVNEFLSSSDDGFQISVKAGNGDMEERFGKVLTMTQILQYAGSSLEPEQLGKIIKSMPFGATELATSSLTIDDDIATNNILALDRGEQVQADKNDNHKYLIKTYIHRMRKPDFKLLHPQIQQMYQQLVDVHSQLEQQRLMAAQQMEAGMIPMGGFLITVNASHKNDEGKVQRIKLPSESLLWLIEKLQQQGMFLQELEQLPPQVAADMAMDMGNAQQQANGPIMPQA